MTDAHVHIEKGPYAKEWINQFVNYAMKNDIEELYLLEHSHRFIDFSGLYTDISEYNEYQNSWINRKLANNIDDYINLIIECKNEKYPIKIYWGLEVCYIKGKENIIKKVTNKYNFDFITGSIHWIDNWGFDHKKEFWNNKNIDDIYKRYYELMIDLIDSNLFDHLAHPESIKCFYNYPSIDLRTYYLQIAQKAKTNNVAIEFNNGLMLNYNHTELGLSKDFINILKQNKVKIISASDAHKPEDVGKNIKIIYNTLYENSD